MEKKHSLAYYILLIIVGYFIISITLHEYLEIRFYVLNNPSSLPFYIIYISAGVLSLIAWLVLRYRDRPINPSSFPGSFLHDNPVSVGYADYEQQKDYD